MYHKKPRDREVIVEENFFTYQTRWFIIINRVIHREVVDIEWQRTSVSKCQFRISNIGRRLSIWIRKDTFFSFST